MLITNAALLGALFDDNANDTQQMLKYAIEAIGRQPDNVQTVAIKEMHYVVPYGDEFAASQRLCRYLKVCLAIRLCLLKESKLTQYIYVDVLSKKDLFLLCLVLGFVLKTTFQKSMEAT